MRRTVRRLAVLTASTVATVLAATTLAAPAQAAHPRAERSADWLTGQLTDGLLHNDQYGFDDYGLTIDAALALKAIRGHQRTVREISDAVAAEVNEYITGESYGDAGSSYAGPVAKTLVLAQAAKADFTAYGGVNLVQRLDRRVLRTGVVRGRIADKTTFGTDYANVLGQAYAVRGLTMAGSPQANKALRFLLKQQCDRGYFRLNFTASKTRRNQTCDGGNRTNSPPDTDVTAVALLTLQAVRPRTRPVRSAINDGVRWLKARQKKNGSFGGGTSTEASNTNSTGLAAWTLGRAGACVPARKAARWVRAHQVAGETSPSLLAEENGAIAYRRGPLKTAQQEGITVEARDQWRRATTQAAPALNYLSIKRCRAA